VCFLIARSALDDLQLPWLVSQALR
jgi:hypothetical protein